MLPKKCPFFKGDFSEKIIQKSDQFFCKKYENPAIFLKSKRDQRTTSSWRNYKKYSGEVNTKKRPL
jgi:hypothetical protein